AVGGVADEIGVDRHIAAGIDRGVGVDVRLRVPSDVGNLDRPANANGTGRQAADEAGVADLALGPDVDVAPRVDADARTDERHRALRHGRAIDRAGDRVATDGAVDPALVRADGAADVLRVAGGPVVIRVGQRADHQRGPAGLAFGARARVGDSTVRHALDRAVAGVAVGVARAIGHADRPDRHRPDQPDDPHCGAQGVSLHAVVRQGVDVDVLLGVDVGAVADVGLRRVLQQAAVDAAGDAGDAPAQPAGEREVGGLIDRRDVDGLRRAGAGRVGVDVGVVS